MMIMKLSYFKKTFNPCQKKCILFQEKKMSHLDHLDDQIDIEMIFVFPHHQSVTEKHDF